MKKFLSLFLALTMLVGMTAMFAISASAEDGADTSATEEEITYANIGVKIYSVANDPYVYLLFDEPMAVPAEDASITFSLCALGWPTEGDDHPETIRDISRVEYTYQGMVGESGKVMKFANMQNGAPSMDHIPWGLGGLNINAESPIAVDPFGGYWYYALLGDQLYTADGTAAFEYELSVDDPRGISTQPGHMIKKTDKDNSTFAVLTVSSVYDFIPDEKDTEPVDTQPADTKPADTKPADTKPADTQPAESKPADTNKTTEEPAGNNLGLIIGIVAGVVVVLAVVAVVVFKKKK